MRQNALNPLFLIFKNSLNALYFLSLLFWTKSVGSGLSFKKVVIWNTGYSQYQTIVQDQICIHVDPGGTLMFPQKFLNQICSQKQNYYLTLHSDRYHTSYIKYLKHIDPKLKEMSTNNIFFNNLISKKTALLSYGHLDDSQLSEVINSNFNQKLNLKNLNLNLILINHGQPKYLTQEKIARLSRYKMLITGSQSRKYENHKITENKFLKINKSLVLKNKWGHLIFESL